MVISVNDTLQAASCTIYIYMCVCVCTHTISPTVAHRNKSWQTILHRRRAKHKKPWARCTLLPACQLEPTCLSGLLLKIPIPSQFPLLQANAAAEVARGARLAETQQQEEVASIAKQVCQPSLRL